MSAKAGEVHGQGERARLIEAMIDEAGDGDVELAEAQRERVGGALIDALIAGKRGEEEILGPGGVLGQLTRRLIERALSEELSEQLGYPAGQAPCGGAGNSRNGGTPKTVLTDQGSVRIDTPRDRNGRFEPQLVKKGQRRLAGLDEKIVALYAGGMSTREIETYISDLYGPGVSRETVSRVSAAVLADANACRAGRWRRSTRSSTSTPWWSRSATTTRSEIWPAIWRSESTSRASATRWACGLSRPRAPSSGSRC